MKGTELDFSATLGAFRAALKAAVPGDAEMNGMRLYGVAMAAGRPRLGGFAPVAGGFVEPKRRVPRAVVAGDNTTRAVEGDGAGFAGTSGDAGFALAGHPPGNTGGTNVAPRQDGGVETSYRAVVARARGDVAVGKARRAAERAALHLPARMMAFTEKSVAPLPSCHDVDEVWHMPGRRGAAAMPALPRRGGLSGSITGAAAVLAPGQSWHGEVEGQQHLAIPQLAPPQPTSFDMERALDDYFFRKSRLPPAGGVGFNPLLSPVWAGLKIPG